MSNIVTISSYRKTKETSTTSSSNGSSASTAPVDAYAIGNVIYTTDAKNNPLDADLFGYSDTTDQNKLKKLTWVQIKSLLRTYFNSLFAGINHNHDSSYAAISHTHTNKADLVNGVVPASQLPSYVDDVVEVYIVGSAFSSSWLSLSVGGSALLPEPGKVYVVLTAGNYYNKTYRWGGSTYVVIGSDLTLGETASTAYRGDLGAATKAVVDAATPLDIANTLVKRDATGKIAVTSLEINGWTMIID